VHGDGLNAPRKSAKQRDRIERLTNTGEWKPRSEFDSLPKSEISPTNADRMQTRLAPQSR